MKKIIRFFAHAFEFISIVLALPAAIVFDLSTIMNKWAMGNGKE